MIAQTTTDVVPDGDPMDQSSTSVCTNAVPVATQTIRTLDHGDVRVTVPTWATDVFGADRTGFLGDVSMSGDEISMEVSVYDGHTRTNTPATFFRGCIQAEPFCEEPRARAPYVHLHASEDEVAEYCGPDDLAKISAELRAHADRVDALRDRLIEARATHVAPTAPTRIAGIPEDLAKQLFKMGLELRIDRLDDGQCALRTYLHGRQILEVREGQPAADADAALAAVLDTLRGGRA